MDLASAVPTWQRREKLILIRYLEDFLLTLQLSFSCQGGKESPAEIALLNEALTINGQCASQITDGAAASSALSHQGFPGPMAKKPKNSDADAEAPKDGEGAEGAAKPGGIKGLLGNKLVLAGVGVVVLGLLGGGGWFFFLKKPKVDAAEQAAKPPPRTTSFVDMKEMLVNIAGSQPGERQTIIKVKVALEIADAKMAPDIQPLLPRIEDMFQVYLRELRPADLEGSAGTFRLKEELLRRVNAAVHPAKVDAVLFKELLVQ